MTPTLNWRNYDKSFSVQLPIGQYCAGRCWRCAPVTRYSRKYITFLLVKSIRSANAVRHIPEPGALGIPHSSHMVEHLHSEEARVFLTKATRVLGRGNILRLAVSNLRYHIDSYLADGDANANAFIANLHTASPRRFGIWQQLLAPPIGELCHLWKYDGASTVELVKRAGFVDAGMLPPGEARIPDASGANLFERMVESVFIEAVAR